MRTIPPGITPEQRQEARFQLIDLLVEQIIREALQAQRTPETDHDDPSSL